MEALAPVPRGPGAPLAGPRHASLRRAFADWIRQVLEGSGPVSAEPGLSGVLRRLEEAGKIGEMGTLLAERIDAFAERNLERGREQGLEAERALLARQAARKFDAETAERLAALLGGIDDPGRLAGIGETAIDCADDEALPERAAAAGWPGRAAAPGSPRAVAAGRPGGRRGRIGLPGVRLRAVRRRRAAPDDGMRPPARETLRCRYSRGSSPAARKTTASWRWPTGNCWKWSCPGR